MTNEEAVKREAVLNTLDTMDAALDENRTVEAYKELLKEYFKELPRVTPKITECEHTVSREAVLEAVKNNYRMAAIDVIEKLPPVTPKPRWIPVSERLPENRNLVLVTAYWHETYQVMVGSYWGNGVWWCAPWNNTSRENLKMLNPVAWMPLPAPYKAEGEEA